MAYIIRASQKATTEAVRIREIQVPEGAPEWITPEYVDQCMRDVESQKAWKPNVGDWYFRDNPWVVKRIEDLAGYFFDPEPEDPGTLGSASHLDANGRWPCDTYLPEPNK